MKTIKSFIILLSFCTSIFSQSNINYDKFNSLLFKKSSGITSDFIKNQTKKDKKEYDVEKLLKLDREIDRFDTTYRGQSIYRKCKPYAEKNYYYSKLEKSTRKSLKEDKVAIASANSNYMKNLYITRYNNGVKRLNEYSKKLDLSLNRLDLCLGDEKNTKKTLLKNYNSLQKELAASYIKKWQNKNTYTNINTNSNKTYNIEENDKMEWNSGSLDDLIGKAKNKSTFAFAFICDPNKEICQETYNDIFKVSSTNTWSSKYNTVNLLYKNFVSGKFNLKETATFLERNNIKHYPVFIWFNSDGEIVEKRTGVETDINLISTKLIAQQTADIDNFNDNLKKIGCDDILCAYKEMHRIFLKTPELKRNYKLYKLIRYRPGKLNSPELKWLLNFPDFKELSTKDKINTFYSALEFSYFKETGDYELTEAFNSYATDEKLKPLGKYAEAFKKYLIEEGEGLGFLITESKTDRYSVYKNFDNGKLKYKGFRTKKGKYKIGKWLYYYESGQIKNEFELDKDSRIIGKYNTYYEDGNIFEICENLKGTENNKCIQYHKNGKIKAKGNRNYWDKNKNGIWSHYYKTGELLSKGSYKASFKIDLWKEYHKNGNLKAKGSYTNYVGDSKTGKWEYYKENNKKHITEEYDYSNKKMLKTEFYPNGKIQYKFDFLYKSNKTNLWRIIDSYNLKGIQTLKNGTGIYKVYYPNSNQLQHTAKMKNGIRDGIANWYYKNGQLKQSVIYKYSEKGNSSGLRWEVLIMFDKEGNPLEKGTLKNGNGTWKSYDENGKLTGVSTYKNGIEVDSHSVK